MNKGGDIMKTRYQKKIGLLLFLVASEGLDGWKRIIESVGGIEK